MKLKRKNAITCTGDDYKVKMLRQFLEKMDLNTDTWDYVQVKCNGKAINLDEGAVNLLIDYYTNVYDPKKDAYSSEYVGASNRPAPRKRAIKATNEVYRNTDQNAFPVFLGNVEDALEVATEGAEGIYDIQGTRFVSDDVVDYELIVRDKYDRPQEIGYITIEQSADGFRAWRGDDEETEFISGGSFDDILDACVENCAILIEDYENGIQDSPLA